MNNDGPRTFREIGAYSSTTVRQIMDAVGPNMWEAFKMWTIGQTMPLINGRTGYYRCDVERFLKKAPVTD